MAQDLYLITGGAGFFGISLARYLLSRGHRVRSLDIASFDYPERDRVEAVAGDIRDRETVERAMAGIDIVMHGAAALPLCSKAAILSSGIAGTRLLLESAFRHNVARFAASLSLLLAGWLAAPVDAAAPSAPSPEQAAEYRAERPKTVVELQQFRRSASIAAEGVAGRRGKATLVDVNPAINAWFLLTLDWGERGGRETYHLENPNPRGQTIALADAEPRGVRLAVGGRSADCDLWADGPTVLDRAKRSALPYAPLCGGRLFLRNRVAGGATQLERVTDFLRDHVWGGEAIIGVVREEFYRDVFLENGAAGVGGAASGPALPNAPAPASLGADYAGRSVVPEHLGIGLADAADALVLGRWYKVAGLAGVYASAIAPLAVAPDILSSDRASVNGLDAVEGKALVYLVAFDLADFDVGFALGTAHPRVDWSDRPPSDIRDRGLPGPDGIGTIAPLVANGMVSPALASRMIAAFTGGFKRQHGAFRYGPLARENHGSHYGFIEQGAVLSKLVPRLATLYVLEDGTLGMKTWTVEDDSLLPRIKFARQNGVPLVEYDRATGAAVPGPLVNRWGPGNWSGTADETLRTLRAGACLQETGARRFLVYGYFSAATPSAMARVFQAYDCRYAMLLDMNALEHTYLALYVRKGSGLVVEHLVQGMEQVDKKSGGRLVPRFLGFPDDRDFFYLVRKEPAP